MKYLLSFSLGLAVVSALTCARRPYSRTLQSSSDLVSEEDLKECSSKMHITFPKSTRALEIYKVTGGPDDGIFLKIEIDRKDLDSLLKLSPFADLELRSDRRFVLKEPTLSWWDPDTVRNYRSAQAGLPDAKYLNILLDLDRNDGITVYLQWGET
jgi:hypothetical protein